MYVEKLQILNIDFGFTTLLTLGLGRDGVGLVKPTCHKALRKMVCGLNQTYGELDQPYEHFGRVSARA